MSVTHADDDDDDDDDDHMPIATNKLWKTECGSCHVAYPPNLLPAASWRKIIRGLDEHFGTDASLTASETREVAAFLEKNAGRNRHDTSGRPLLRITETRWFQHEHDEVSGRAWKNPKVKSAANCAACHTLAEDGNYSERYIKIPR